MHHVNTAPRLHRSRRDRTFTGVSGGLAAYLGVDPTLVRIGWVLLTLTSGPIAPVAYLALAAVIPNEPDDTFQI